MLYFNADPRDGGPKGAVCNTCCCQPMQLKPGETNLVELNYAPWSLPIGYPGIISGTEFHVEVEAEGCSAEAPTNTNYPVTTAVDTAAVIDVSANAAPGGGSFTYIAPVPLTGPSNGSVSVSGSDITYTPNTGFQGYDYFSYEMLDDQNRSIIYTIEVNVGTHTSRPNRALMATAPFVDAGKVTVDQRLHTIRFPIYMPLSCRPCATYKMNVKQPARDCDGNVYNHLSCFDISCKDC